MFIPDQTAISATRRNVVTFFLALGTFCLGMTEFVAMGLLKNIADSYKVSPDVASHVVTAYALGVVVGAPLITVFAARADRRKLILLLVLALIVGNGLTVLAGSTDSFALIMGSRFTAGLPHGAYFSLATLIAASMAPKGQRGRAIARVGVGLAVATVVGVPIAQSIGQRFGWNLAFLLVTLFGLVTFLGLFFLLPYMTQMKLVDPRTELGAFKNSQVLLTLLIGTVGFGGMFAVYSFISYIIEGRAHLDSRWMPYVLMVYGIGMVLGTYLGGWLSDRNLEFGIFSALIAITAALVAFYFTSHWAVPAIINFGVIGLLGSTLTPNLQTRLMDVAGEAQTLAAASNHSALNMANAAGAWLGGIAMAQWGLGAPALVGAVLAVLGIGAWVISYRLRIKSGWDPSYSAQY